MNKELLREAMNIKTWQEKYAYEREHEVTDSQTRCKWMQEEIDVLRAAIDAPEQEPFGWYSVKHDEFMLHLRKTEHDRLGSYTSKVGGFDAPLYTKPQPVADLQIKLDIMTAERDKLHRENGDMRQSLHFFKPADDLTDDEILKVFAIPNVIGVNVPQL